MHTFRNTNTTLIALCLILALAAPAAATVTARQDIEPVTLYVLDSPYYDTTSLDPTDLTSPHFDNLFLGLVAADPISGQPVPQLATSWTVSDNGLVWTFTLRSDVSWVQWDAAAGEAVVLHTVTAHDAAFALQRICDPAIEAYLIVPDLIKGCSTLQALPPNETTLADYDLVQVRALDDTTLEVTLNYPSAFLLSLLTLPIGRPVPRELVEEHGTAWATPGILVTNGSFLVEEWLPDVRLWLTANPWLPDDLRGPGNIERVLITPVDLDSRVPLYEADQFDVMQLYESHVPTALESFPEQLAVRYALIVHYFAFMLDIPPFDDVHVRRAFAAAFDREQVVNPLAAFPLVPMVHFISPGVVGAPPLNEPGMGFDPDYARAELALAGYPNCEGFPDVTLVMWDFVERWGDVFVANMEANLGCDPGLFTVESVPWEMWYNLCNDTLPAEYRANICYAYWAPDFGDAHNYEQVLSCSGQGWGTMRACSEIDDLIEQAAVETDIAQRTALYWDIEDRFFGTDGVFPIVPILMHGYYWAMKPWLDGPVASDSIGGFGDMHFDWYTIDQEMQRTARGE